MKLLQLSNIILSATVFTQSLSSIPVQAITITTDSIATELVNTLIGTNSGITIVGSPSYSGSSLAAGLFDGGNNNNAIGIDKGIVLSTGKVADIPGSYNLAVTGTEFGIAGDKDLTKVVPGSFTEDAATLSFNFTSVTNDLYLLSYIFASQEYSKFVNTQYNDVFGYYLDGVNIATIPGTGQPITVNTINNGNFGGGVNSSNPSLFVNNQSNALGIIFGGRTVPLSAQALHLSPGVHSFKLAIADVNDGFLDSAVFLQGGSFAATPTGTVPTSVPEPLQLLGTLIAGAAAVALRRSTKSK